MCGVAAAVAACAGQVLASECTGGPTFDDPLVEFHRITGPVHAAIAGVGTEEGDRQFAIDVPGTPVGAWIYWLGVVWREADGTIGDPDYSITLSGGALTAPIDLYGTEVGRRHVLCADEPDVGGEVVMKAAVPLEAFAPGLNVFTISNFNERQPNSNRRIYRQQYGVTMFVTYQDPGSTDAREVIALEGADVANYFRYVQSTVGYPEQANSDVICFQFDPIAEDTTATLLIGDGGVYEDVHTVPGTNRIVTASPERTWFDSGSGATPTMLVGTAQLLEDNRIIDGDYFFHGNKMGHYRGQVQLHAGDTWACFQHEMLPKLPTNIDPVNGHNVAQNFTAHVASLEIDRAETTGTCDLTLEMSVQPPLVYTPEPDCGGKKGHGRKLQLIEVEYTGEGCDLSDHEQGDDVLCEGGASFADPVTLQFYRLDKETGWQLVSEHTGVHLGDRVRVSAGEIGEKDFGRKLRITVIDETLNQVIEEVRFSPKCEDQPNVGDQFGSFFVVAVKFDKLSEVSIARATTVYYTVANNGDGSAGEVVVEDDLLGEVGRIPELLPGEVEVLTAHTTTWKTTTFDAVARGSGNCDEATGSVTQEFLRSPDPCEKGQCGAGKDHAKGVSELAMTYTGDSCTAMSNTQRGKAFCEGDAGFVEPVTIHAADKDDNVVKTFTDVALGDAVRLTSDDFGSSKLPSDVRYTIETPDGSFLARVGVHTSCSQQLAEGDQFGPLTTRSLVVKEPPKECKEGSCRGGLRQLTVRYAGGGCDNTTNDQGGRVVCVGDAGTTEPVTVLVLDKRGTVIRTFENVRIGDLLTVTAGDEPDDPEEVGELPKRMREGETEKERERERLPNDILYRVLDPGTGDTLAEVRFHISCSKPLAVGDLFGFVRVHSFYSRRGGEKKKHDSVPLPPEVGGWVGSGNEPILSGGQR
ncbi:MAG: hypothetical protein D6718_05840 [Acidobacteria bacterium]|nr:MAG: hypothetical protein D6718_05840 [Acidobacteriota bacterium]